MLERLPVRYRTTSGHPLISVTQTLTLAGRIDDRWFTPEAAWRGQVVHDLTERIDRHESIVIPVGLEGYVRAYQRFLDAVQPTYCASELQVVNPLLGFAGRIDRVCCALFGAPGLLDFKTGDQCAWHGQQLAAYNMLRPTGARWGCYLQANGQYRLKAYDDPQDHRRFAFDLAATRGTVTADGDYWIGTF